MFDVYLVLGVVAASRMKTDYLAWLPPFGWQFAAEIPFGVYLLVIFWTGFLAAGCLYGSNTPAYDGASNGADELKIEG